MSSFAELPATAAWSHRDARSGFEVVHLRQDDNGHHMDGCTSAVEDGQAWFVRYEITVDSDWATRAARITGRSPTGWHTVLIESDGAGRWLIDGMAAPKLDGCLDVDLESSAMTNMLPVHRLGLPVDGRAAAPAVYVRATDLSVERLEQEYRRTADDGSRQCYEYSAPAFDFACRLIYDVSGLVLSYPGIAIRVA
ncbi:putative glycolipid-binding domain-containing protein [Nocardia rhamnosiphila]|uniref:putative glycolipid-binding domain-containing protein n=1 Tax=Nocardia rhamnosiphila TaxID=426716 RepID=UPI0004C30001|nr:putative glycolipid-binding domain-containing protein [Nocardia rhamnosiphila]